MLPNLNSMTLSNPFANVSLGDVLGRRNDPEENRQSFSNDFKQQLMGVSQTSSKELRELPAVEQSVGSAVRDSLRAALLSVEAQVHKLDKPSTGVLIDKTGVGINLTYDLRALSGASSRVIESLSMLIDSLQGQGRDGFEIPHQLRVDVKQALTNLEGVSKAVGVIDKARPTARTPIALGLVSVVGLAVIAAIKEIDELIKLAGKSDVEDNATASPFTTMQPPTSNVPAMKVAGIAVAASLSAVTASAGLYQLKHRAPSLLEFTNALAKLEQALSGLQKSFSNAERFSGYVNTAHAKFYASPSTDVRELAASEFSASAFVEKDDVAAPADGAAAEVVAAAVEDVEDLFEDAVEYLVEDAVAGEVIEMQNIPLEAVVVEGMAPIPGRRQSMMSTPT
jgi:hypothetical protein